MLNPVGDGQPTAGLNSTTGSKDSFNESNLWFEGRLKSKSRLALRMGVTSPRSSFPLGAASHASTVMRVTLSGGARAHLGHLSHLGLSDGQLVSKWSWKITNLLVDGKLTMKKAAKDKSKGEAKAAGKKAATKTGEDSDLDVDNEEEEQKEDEEPLAKVFECEPSDLKIPTFLQLNFC